MVDEEIFGFDHEYWCKVRKYLVLMVNIGVYLGKYLDLIVKIGVN